MAEAEQKPVEDVVVVVEDKLIIGSSSSSSSSSTGTAEVVEEKRDDDLSIQDEQKEDSAGKEESGEKEDPVEVSVELNEGEIIVASVAEEVVGTDKDVTSASENATDITNETPEQEEEPEQETEASEPVIKLETAPVDFRFPTTNQSRHCFTRYIEYHRCIAAKGEGAPECDKFAKYYRSLCPGEWVDRWNEQRENGTFPGPL